jgi:hypothetical protein
VGEITRSNEVLYIPKYCTVFAHMDEIYGKVLKTPRILRHILMNFIDPHNFYSSIRIYFLDLTPHLQGQASWYLTS